jgi:hypothetical protein
MAISQIANILPANRARGQHIARTRIPLINFYRRFRPFLMPKEREV